MFHQCITAYKNINASSSDTEVEDTPMDDIDENALDDATYEVYETTRKRLNTSLETVGMSPVNLYGVLQHYHATSDKQKFYKVVDTYKSTIAETYDVSRDVLDTSNSVFEESDAQWKAAELERLHDAMREKLKTASYPEKIQILTLIPDKWSREYASKQFNVREYLIQIARELKKFGGILAKHVPKKGKTLPQETLDLVQSLYEDDECSRQLPGKKDFVSISRNVHKQKQLVLCNLSELHSAFRD